MKKEGLSVAFTDIDGCLNSEEFWYSDRNPGNLNGNEGSLDPECIKRVRTICEKTDAKIVVSSGWRRDWQDTLTRLNKAGLEGLIIDKTPYIPYIMQDLNGNYINRGIEIQEWLNQHPDVTNYVILDDIWEFTEEQIDNVVLCNREVGITDEDVEKAIKILTE